MSFWKKLKFSVSSSSSSRSPPQPPLPVPPAIPPLASQPTPPAPASPSPPHNDSVFHWSTHYLRLCPPLTQKSSDAPQLNLPPFSPFPRYGFSSPQNPSPENHLYIFGGLVANKEQNDLYRISTRDLSSALIETIGDLPSPRVGHSSVLLNNVFAVWGGDTNIHQNPNHKQDNALYLLNLHSREWTRFDTPGPTPVGRYGHTLVLLGSQIILFGGQSDREFFDDLWSFDLKSLKTNPLWDCRLEPASSERPSPRTGHVCVPYGDHQLIIFGGTDGKFYYNDTWSFNLHTSIWTELRCTGHIPVPRESHAATIVDDTLYIFGGRGRDAQDLGDLVALKISSRRWFAFQDDTTHDFQLPSARSGHAMATVASCVYLFGGESFAKPVFDDCTPIHILDTRLLKYPERGVANTATASSRSLFHSSSATFLSLS